MSKCTVCNTDGAYIGFSLIECRNPNCRCYKKTDNEGHELTAEFIKSWFKEDAGKLLGDFYNTVIFDEASYLMKDK